MSDQPGQRSTAASHEDGRALDVARINDVIARFAHCLDDGRLDRLEELFRMDASFDIHPAPAPATLVVPMHGRDAICRGLGERHAVHERAGQRRHVASTVTVDFLSDTLATARSYQTTVLTPKDVGGPHILGVGVYHDRLVAENAMWQFASRIYRADPV